MSVAPMTRPFETGDATEIARRILADRFTTEAGRLGLREWRGSFWEWYGGRKWVKRERQWVEDQVILELADAHVRGTGRGAVEVLEVGGSKVEHVVRTMEAMVRLEVQDVPCWLDGTGEGRPDPRYCVGFEDVVVDVRGTALRRMGGVGGWSVVERDETWFDVFTVPCAWDGEARCPRWMRCLEEWFGVDEESKELAARMMGYGLMATRKYGRGPLLIGKIRGGKGVFTRRWKKMLGSAFVGTTMSHLVSNFGLAGTQHARVVSVGEVHGLERTGGEAFAGIWKNWIGGDEMPVNIKYQGAVVGVVRALPVMSSNEMPALPNKGAGMSGKLLVLPFDHSFLGREQLDLEEELDGELPGLARWALEGAVRLEGEMAPERKWPVSERAADVLRTYRIMNNPFDGFLEARFVRNPEGRVATRVVLAEWQDWLRSTGMPIRVAPNQVMLKLEQESTWGVRRYREPGGGDRCLKGLSVRREAEDEV